MEGDVQQEYLAAEQAYGEGDFDQAEAIASALLSRLDITTSSGAEEEACLAWRAFVALLLGHIYFHGLHQPNTAEEHYQLVLASRPPDTLRDLAQQGVERCRALADQGLSNDPVSGGSSEEVDGASMISAPPTSARDNNSGMDAVPTLDQGLIQDPFLSSVSGTTTPVPATHDSAAPWLQSEAQSASDGDDNESIADAPVDSPESSAATLIESATTEVQVVDASDVAVASSATTTDADPTDDDGTPPLNNVVTLTSVEPDEAHTPAPEAAPQAGVEDLPSEQPAMAVEPLDLSPWLLRRTITSNKG